MSKKSTLTYSGSVSKTGILDFNKKKMQVELLIFKECLVEVVIRLKKTRSTPQNNYYRGIVINTAREGFKEIGYIMTNDQTHEYFKKKFNIVQLCNKEGIIIEVPDTTTELNTVEFCEYVEKIRQFSAEYLGIDIPSPNTELTLFKTV